MAGLNHARLQHRGKIAESIKDPKKITRPNPYGAKPGRSLSAAEIAKIAAERGLTLAR